MSCLLPPTLGDAPIERARVDDERQGAKAQVQHQGSHRACASSSYVHAFGALMGPYNCETQPRLQQARELHTHTYTHACNACMHMHAWRYMHACDACGTGTAPRLQPGLERRQGGTFACRSRFEGGAERLGRALPIANCLANCLANRLAGLRAVRRYSRLQPHIRAGRTIYRIVGANEAKSTLKEAIRG